MVSSGIIIIGMVLGVLVVIPAIFVIGAYNSLVTLRNRFKNGYSQIDVQLKRRHDLIPNLVETAKGYMTHERETLEKVIQARNSAVAARQAATDNPGDGGAIKALAGAEVALTGMLGNLFALREAYPDLKADRSMNTLMEELTSTENKVAFARQAFNDQVMAYNTYRQSFPPVAVAGVFGHGQDASLLEFADSEQIQEAPKVSF